MWHKDAIGYLAFSILTLLKNNKVCPNLLFQVIYVAHLFIFQLSKLLPILMRYSTTNTIVTIYVRVSSVLLWRCFSFCREKIHYSFHLGEKCIEWQPCPMWRWVEFTLDNIWCFEGVSPSTILHLSRSFWSAPLVDACSLGIHVVDYSFPMMV